MKMQRQRWIAISPAIAGLFVVGLSWAEVPVVESSPVVGAAVPSASPAASAPAQARIQAENTLYYQLELLQQEVQTLRGMLEEQSHALRLMKQEQRDRYIDLDRRISQLSSAEPTISLPAKSPTTVVPPVIPSNGGAASPAATTTTADPAVEKQAYDDAFALIKERKFDQAIIALNAFVDSYPQGDYAANAQYWLGEVYLATNQAGPARTAFEKVLSDFPNHRKAPDASYKLGRMYHSLGDVEAARRYFQQTVERFPGSSSAKLSREYLQKL
ncbi:tol-pal system protein YbgF [Aestuariirhabdus litorea]|nr:tol-pal system protein YbgF [Aestuariirhabdus litorea]